jgi:flagellar hook-length control protein FliK
MAQAAGPVPDSSERLVAATTTAPTPPIPPVTPPSSPPSSRASNPSAVADARRTAVVGVDAGADAPARASAAPKPPAEDATSVISAAPAAVAVPAPVPADQPATAPVDAPEAAAPPRPAEQLVRVVAPFRAAPDGSHEVTLALRPEGLGDVQVSIVVDQGVVHVALTAAATETTAVLQQALPDLRAGLVAAGLAAGQLAVTDDAGGRRRPDGSPEYGRHRRRSPAASSRTAAVAAPALSRSTADAVDLFL